MWPHRSPVYVCAVAGGTLRRNWESFAVRFFPVTRLPLGLFPWYRPVIRDAVAGRTHREPVRQHLGTFATVVAGLIHIGGVIGILE